MPRDLLAQPIQPAKQPRDLLANVPPPPDPSIKPMRTDSIFARAPKAAVLGIGAAVRPINSAISKVTSWLPSKVEKLSQKLGTKIGSDLRTAVGEKTADTIGTIANKPVAKAVQTAKNAYHSPLNSLNRPVIEGIGQTLKQPDVQEALGAVAQVGEFAGNVVGAKEVLKPVLAASKAKLQAKYQPQMVDALEADYSKWAGQTKPGVKLLNRTKAKTTALNRSGTTGKTPQRILAEEGLVPETKGTKFSTADQAKNYRASQQYLYDAQQAAIREAETSPKVGKISIDDMERRAIAEVRTAKNIAAGKADDLTAEIRREFAGYRQNYGNEIPLSIVDDIKTARYGDMSFDFTKPTKMDVNRAIAKTAQKTIEETATKAGFDDLAQLNREIGSRMDAADFLHALDGQTLKYGKIGKYAFMGIGASAGNTLGGKVLGALGGEMIADFLMKADVANPVKRLVLNSLQKNQPQVYTEVMNWLKQQGLDRELRLALPPPKGMPLGGNPARGSTPGFPNYNPPGLDPMKR